MTTSNSAAAIRTAAVGDSPKIVVRSVTAERGRAEPPSSRPLFMVLLELASFSVVVVVLLELLPPGAGALSVPDALPLTLPDAGALLDDEELED